MEGSKHGILSLFHELSNYIINHQMKKERMEGIKREHVHMQ